MRKISILCLLSLMTSLHGSAVSAADGSKPAAGSAIAGGVAKKQVIQRPKFHIDTGTATHSSNTFNDIRQSMPAAAVKEDLARKHELPSEQTSLLHAGGAAGVPTVSGAGAGAGAAAKNAQAATGAAPDVLSPGRVAIPESTGTSNTFFK